MSKENLETLRAVVDAWNRGDSEAAFRHAAPDIEFDNTRDLGEWRGLHTTREEAMQAWERFADPWESVHIEIDELVDAGDQVVCRVTGTLRGRDGIEVEARNNWLWRFRDRQVTHLVSYREFDDALEGAGLSR